MSLESPRAATLPFVAQTRHGPAEKLVEEGVLPPCSQVTAWNVHDAQAFAADLVLESAVEGPDVLGLLFPAGRTESRSITGGRGVHP